MGKKLSASDRLDELIGERDEIAGVISGLKGRKQGDIAQARRQLGLALERIEASIRLLRREMEFGITVFKGAYHD